MTKEIRRVEKNANCTFQHLSGVYTISDYSAPTCQCLSTRCISIIIHVWAQYPTKKHISMMPKFKTLSVSVHLLQIVPE